MKYFIMLPGDTQKEVHYESNEIGEDTGFGVFWAGSGLKALMYIVDSQPEILPHITIKTDRGNVLSVSEFLDKIKKLKVRAN